MDLATSRPSHLLTLSSAILALASCGRKAVLSSDAAPDAAAPTDLADAIAESIDAAVQPTDAAFDADGDDDRDGEAGLTVDDFCTLKATVECQVAERCNVPLAACVAPRRTGCLAFAAAAASPRVFHPENVSGCLDAAQAAYAKAVITPADLALEDDQCSYVFQGDVAKLFACTTKYDCAGRVICDKGLCADRHVVAQDGLCPNPGAVCEVGQTCAKEGDHFGCVARHGSGESCDGTPCLESLRCAGGTCAARLATGGLCQVDGDCSPAAPFCDPYAGSRCSPGLTFAVGAPSCGPFGG